MRAERSPFFLGRHRKLEPRFARDTVGVPQEGGDVPEQYGRLIGGSRPINSRL